MLVLRRQVEVKGEFFALVLLRRFFLLREPQNALLKLLCLPGARFRLNQPQIPAPFQSLPLPSIYISKGVI